MTDEGKSVGNPLHRVNVFDSPLHIHAVFEVHGPQRVQDRDEGCGPFPERVVGGLGISPFILKMNADDAAQMIANELDRIVAVGVEMAYVEGCANPGGSLPECLNIAGGRAHFMSIGRIVDLIVQSHGDLVFLARRVKPREQRSVEIPAKGSYAERSPGLEASSDLLVTDGAWQVYKVGSDRDACAREPFFPGGKLSVNRLEGVQVAVPKLRARKADVRNVLERVSQRKVTEAPGHAANMEAADDRGVRLWRRRGWPGLGKGWRDRSQSSA
jgi:hypothetical protein